MSALAFSHINLRFNPFGDLPAELWGKLAVVDGFEVGADEIVQLMGEQGRGKTTHLWALAARYPGSRYEYVPEGARHFQSREVPAAGFLLDEAQRVRPRQLRSLDRRARRLVLATHADLSRHFRRPVRTVRVGGLDATKLERIVTARIEAARRGPGALPRLPSGAFLRLLRRFDDDLRTMFDHLYEVFQQLEEVCDVEV